MSQENVDLVRAANEALNSGGPRGALDFLDPDVEFHEPPEQPAPRILRGRKAAIRAYEAFDEAWEEHTSRIEEIRDLGGGRVLVLSTEIMRGRGGIEFKQPAGGVFTCRNGKVIRMQMFWTRESALEAAGLSE